MIGVAVGRIGDVINGEHHGTPTNLPWGVEYVNAATLGEPGKVVQPEVAYEMVLCLLILAALLPFHQRIKARTPDGVIGLTYFALYGAGRSFLSFLRTHPAVILGLRQPQIASGLVLAIAIIAVPVLFRRAAAIGAPAPVTPDRAESTHEPPREQPAPRVPRRSRVGRKSRQRSRAAGESKPPS